MQKVDSLTLWSYWDGGLAKAPELVRLCVDSWEKFAPSARVIVVDKQSLYDFVRPDDLPPNFDDLIVQHQSDFIRLALLVRYGGVWLDASVFVSQPLLPWLSEVASEAGLFFFRRPGPDRQFSNWFISAESNDFFLTTLHAQLAEFFANPRIHRSDSRYEAGLGRLWISAFRISSRSSRLALLWTLEPLRSLKRYPYHIFHYLGNNLMRKRVFQAAFDGMAFVSADEGHCAARVLARREDFALEALKSGSCPVNKLKLRADYRDADLEVFRTLLAGTSLTD